VKIEIKKLIITIINETNNYNELDGSFKYFEKQYAYDVLSSEININNSSVENFFETLENGNIGKFNKIYQMIDRNQFNSALIANNSIVPTNQIEVNRKWVNGVYLDYVAPQRSIPQTTIDELETLASSSPFVNGDAVYTARAIVGYTEPELNNKNMEQDNPQDEIVTNNPVLVHVYPNPTSDFIIVEVTGEIREPVLFTIYNVLGYKKKEVLISNGKMKIDISDFNQGAYWYDARLSLISINKGKFIISR
jgi:hypothetical protein